jgi:proteasome assembly chaperone (PAC2) family protein
MTNELQLKNPWFIAVWPGMGHVAVSAGFYLIAKLGMHLHREVSPEGIFDIERVEVSDGIIRPAELPRSRYFVYRDPEGKRDGVVFLGEAQPPQGKYRFCKEIIDYAKNLGVSEITTFAAMATDMRPEHDSRVFVAATDEATLDGFVQLETEVLKDGHISGLNGILLGVAADQQLHGACFLGEMPSLFHQFPYPKASLQVLKLFAQSVGLAIDTQELEEQAATMDEQMGQWLRRLERSIQQPPVDETSSDEDEFAAEADEGAETEEGSESFESGPTLGDTAAGSGTPTPLSIQDNQRIETLFEAASSDRAKAYELKRELDRLQVFKQYENRFLDLFRQPPPTESDTKLEG